MTPPSLNEFVEPNWKAPLDANKVLALIPETATISGMFLEPLAKEARRQGQSLSSARERYTAFRFYPLREHVQLLTEACACLYPRRPLRLALRSLGRAGPAALLTSTLGRTGLGAADGVLAVLAAMAKSYAINVPGSSVTVLEDSKTTCILRVQNLPFFLDSHHIGVFEGALRYARAQESSVLIRARSANDADLLCRWR